LAFLPPSLLTGRSLKILTITSCEVTYFFFVNI
jgi:hypothetical protein